MQSITSRTNITRFLGYFASILLITQATVLIYGHFQKEVSYQRPIYESSEFVEPKSNIDFREQSFSGYRYDWSSNKKFVYQNVEVDFFLNHIAPHLTPSELEIVGSCYLKDGALSDWLPTNVRIVSSNEFFNVSGLLKLSNQCNYGDLNSVEQKWADIPFLMKSIFK